MPEKLIRYWCEYDYGQENVVFTSVEAGQNWMSARITEQGDEEITFTNLLENGLIGWETVSLISGDTSE